MRGVILLRYEIVEKDDREVFSIIERWDNDMEIAKFLRPNQKEGPLEPVTADALFEGYVKNKTKILFMIYDDITPIGNVSVDFCFPLFAGDKEYSAWLGICIGHPDYRGRGIGKQVMEYIEGFCRVHSIKRMELGVFSFNEAGKRLYEKMGYKKIAVNKHFVYCNGEWYDDIRMEKYL